MLSLLAASLPHLVLAQDLVKDTCDTGPLPFAAIMKKHPIDDTCKMQGADTDPKAKKPVSKGSHEQNLVKNDFCRAAKAPELVSARWLTDLQAKTDVPSGRGKEPDDRAPLKSLGEGKVVRMKGYLVEAHHADLSGGESVNCFGKKEEDNDIHIAFADTPDEEECRSISAEITPHYRPDSWNEIGHDEKYASGKYHTDPAVDERLKSRPYRVTGQLFYDASHEPCPCGRSKCNPIRASSWEIHPVYALEVCKPELGADKCDPADDNHWTAFDAWWKGQKPIKTHRAHTHPSEGE